MDTGDRSTANRFLDVVTVFLTHSDTVLVLKRSSKVGTYRGHWAGVSGYLESNNALAQALTEMAEEVGLSEEDVTLLKAGKPLEIVDRTRGRAWRVHPFLFAVHEPDKIRLDWENTAMRWILPEEIDQLETVPALKETLERVIKDE
jgi:ADP-ribose pyrophosphatase YjhB (NUDIX family)